MRPADLYFRRTLWLIVFGLLNGYVLLWSGDVLFYYGIAGLMLFIFRTLPPRKLLVLATAFMILQTSITVSEWLDYRETQALAQAASTRQAEGLPMTDGDQEALDAFRSCKVSSARPGRTSRLTWPMCATAIDRPLTYWAPIPATCRANFSFATDWSNAWA